MANRFQDLAQRLITQNFGEYAKPLTLTVKGEYDPITETYGPDQDYIVDAIRLSLDFQQFQNQQIQFGDFRVIFPAIDIPVTPSIADECSYEGRLHQVIHESLDPADAAWQLILRGV